MEPFGYENRLETGDSSVGGSISPLNARTLVQGRDETGLEAYSVMALAAIEDARESLQEAHQRFLTNRSEQNRLNLLETVGNIKDVLRGWLYARFTPGEDTFPDFLEYHPFCPRGVEREEVLKGFDWYIALLNDPKGVLPRECPSRPFDLSRFLVKPNRAVTGEIGATRGN